MDAKTFVVFTEWIKDVEDLTESERAELLLAMFRYVNDQPLPEMQRTTRLVWNGWQRAIDRNISEWERIRENRSKAGKASAEARKKQRAVAEQELTNLTCVDFVEHNVNANANVNENVNGNVNVNGHVNANNSNGPTLEEVIAYYKKMGFSHTSAAQFHAYYSEMNWTDMDGRPIKNWKAVLKGWEAKDSQKRELSGSNKFNNFHQRTYDESALESMLLNTGV